MDIFGSVPRFQVVGKGTMEETDDYSDLDVNTLPTGKISDYANLRYELSRIQKYMKGMPKLKGLLNEHFQNLISAALRAQERYASDYNTYYGKFFMSHDEAEKKAYDNAIKVFDDHKKFYDKMIGGLIHSETGLPK